ncbi:hypothetical protein C3K47_02030 [Solitalea longa]|uniref:Uncharacterized protein n=1 Tax=Solitalea longa TaxID=2079460 RepID=A0A2S5A9P5_9SPHI|nr:hypothetical protein [Solitalea longa]POY39298.1 hypothetical protein C3K47_02030 [Solitalea longa]
MQGIAAQLADTKVLLDADNYGNVLTCIVPFEIMPKKMHRVLAVFQDVKQHYASVKSLVTQNQTTANPVNN